MLVLGLHLIAHAYSNKKVKPTPELRVEVQEIKTNHLEGKKSKVRPRTGHEDPEGQQGR